MTIDTIGLYFLFDTLVIWSYLCLLVFLLILWGGFAKHFIWFHFLFFINKLAIFTCIFENLQWSCSANFFSTCSGCLSLLSPSPFHESHFLLLSGHALISYSVNNCIFHLDWGTWWFWPSGADDHSHHLLSIYFVLIIVPGSLNYFKTETLLFQLHITLILHCCHHFSFRRN